MAEHNLQPGELKDRVVHINRVTKVVKGGKNFSFAALVVVGDGNGWVGFGVGKAREVPSAISKGVDQAKRNIMRVPMKGATIPHEVTGRFCSSKVILIPAAPGTGVIASAQVRAVLEAAGIRDILTKCYGSNNPVNVVKATFDGLAQLRTRKQAQRMRGVNIK